MAAPCASPKRRAPTLPPSTPPPHKRSFTPPSSSSFLAPSSSLALAACPSPAPPPALDDIERLPDEILAHIFAFLHPRRRISVEGVCRRWERLALESWKGTRSLAMRDFRVRERRLVDAYQVMSGANPFPLRPDLVLTRQNVRTLWTRAGPALRAIDFSGSGSKPNRSSLPFLHSSITWELGHIQAPNLTSLVFERVTVNAASLAEGFRNLRGLRKLVLRDSFYENPGHEFSLAMGGLLQRSPGLEELVFTHTSSSCRWLAHLPPAIRLLDLSRTRAPGLRLHAALDGTPDKFPSLHTLDLANVGMSASTLNCRFIVASAPNLRVLDVQYIYADLLAETPALAKLPHLATLNFFHYDPGSQRAFVEALTEPRAPCRDALRTLLVNAESLDADSVCRLGRLPRVERLCLGPSSGLKGSVLRALAAAPALAHLLLANPRGRDRAASADLLSDDADDGDDAASDDF